MSTKKDQRFLRIIIKDSPFVIYCRIFHGSNNLVDLVVFDLPGSTSTQLAVYIATMLSDNFLGDGRVGSDLLFYTSFSQLDEAINFFKLKTLGVEILDQH